MKTRKVLSLLLTLCMIVSLFTGFTAAQAEETGTETTYEAKVVFDPETSGRIFRAYVKSDAGRDFDTTNDRNKDFESNWKKYDTTAGGMAIREYADYDEISDWAEAAIAWANAEGLITGRTDTAIVPRGDATRAEVATILMRFMQKFVK